MVQTDEHGEEARLTPFGRAFSSYRLPDQRVTLRRLMLYREPTRSVMIALRERGTLNTTEIAQVLQTLAPLSLSTAVRRARTIASWIETTGLGAWSGHRIHYTGPSMLVTQQAAA